MKPSSAHPRALVLLLPGMLNTPEIWADVTALLLPHVDVRVADLRAQASIREMARDAWAAVADVPLDTALVVCGFSMGGYVAVEMLAQAHRAIHALGLLGSAGVPETAWSASERVRTQDAIERDFDRFVHAVSVRALHPDNQGNPALLERCRRIMRDAGAHAALRQNRAILERADHRPVLARLALPVLVMGSRADRVAPPSQSEALAALIPGSRLAWITRAGHMGPLEAPTQVAGLLRSLIPATA